MASNTSEGKKTRSYLAMEELLAATFGSGMGSVADNGNLRLQVGEEDLK